MTQMIPAWAEGALQPVDKVDVHLRGLRHPAVSVFILDGDQTLLQRRAMSKYHTPGLWANACCTHPHWHEPFADCAQRRIGEELGIAGLFLEQRSKVEYQAGVGGGMREHEVVHIFVGEGRPNIALNPDEVMDARWISLADLHAEVAASPEKFTPWLRIYLSEHEAEIFNLAG